MFGIEQKVEKAARKGAAFSAAAVFAAVGIAFLTVAAWMVLSELHSDIFAAVVLGFSYLGVAGIVLALGLKKSSRRVAYQDRPHGTESDLSPLQLVVLSFLQGFEEARNKDRSSKRHITRERNL